MSLWDEFVEGITCEPAASAGMLGIVVFGLYVWIGAGIFGLPLPV